MVTSNADNLMNQALALVKQGKLPEAEELFAQICAQDEKNDKAWFLRGVIRLEFGDTKNALDYLNTAVSLNAKNSQAHFLLCKLYTSMGDLSKAISHAKSVTDLDAKHGEAWLALSSFYSDAGQFDQAEHASRTAIKLLPGVAEAKINLVNALISQYKKDEAIALCNSIKEEDELHVGIWHSLGLAFMALGQIQDADHCLSKVTTQEPNNAAALCTLGEIKAAQGDLADALVLYKKSRKLAPTYPKVHFEIGKVLLHNSSKKHWQIMQQLEKDHLYQDIKEAENIARDLAAGFSYDDTEVEGTLARFFEEYDPSQIYTLAWWTEALKRFGDPGLANDTALRSIYSTVFSWSLPCKEALEAIADFAGQRLASFGSGSGYWEYLLSTQFGIKAVCHDMMLHHRFMPMKQTWHADATLDPEDTIFLAWLPGESGIDYAVESLLSQAVAGQKLVLVGEPADEYGNPRTCGTRYFFQYLHTNFTVHATFPLANYAYFVDRVDLLVKK